MVRKKITEHFSGLVVGLKYRVTLMSQEALARKVETEPLECVLKREPENEHDPNAIKVLISDETDTKWNGQFIGYLAKEQAAVIAPFMDTEELTIKQAWLRLVDPKHGEAELDVTIRVRPGLKVQVSRR